MLHHRTASLYWRRMQLTLKQSKANQWTLYQWFVVHLVPLQTLNPSIPVTDQTIMLKDPSRRFAESQWSPARAHVKSLSSPHIIVRAPLSMMLVDDVQRLLYWVFSAIGTKRNPRFMDCCPTEWWSYYAKSHDWVLFSMASRRCIFSNIIGNLEAGDEWIALNRMTRLV